MPVNQRQNRSLRSASPQPRSSNRVSWFNNLLGGASSNAARHNSSSSDQQRSPSASGASYSYGDDSLTRLIYDPEQAIEIKEETASEHLDAASQDRKMPLAFTAPRNVEVMEMTSAAELTTGAAMLLENQAVQQQQSWRMRERMKTVSVALVICLNVGVDPPDVIKTQPCARLECWIDPATLNPQRALEAIGNSLQKQYERWQPKARYKQSLDPPQEEVRRLATGLRRNARDERVLFHYNGHGVPKPTANGEIWVFNRNYTQYIPLSLYDLQAWMGSPSIFVWDCSNAGTIVQAFEQFAEQHEREFYEVMANEQMSEIHQQQQAQMQKQPQVPSQQQAAAAAASEQPKANGNGSTTTTKNGPIDPAPAPAPPRDPPVVKKDCIQLAACAANQILPMNPELPADLFTACLTTPIKMALRWFVLQKHGQLCPDVTLEMLDKIPGMFGDRRTMLGELNWIFTAITDTIAWNTLPRELFQKLFRQDLLVASLFRNFLLSERIMRSYDCTPLSQPSFPPTHQHPMWKAWDLAVDVCLAQLQGIIEKGQPYVSSSFFEEQLTAFEVWLRYGSEKRPPPEQLPIVLQVLLSQAHRLRALDLLGRFLDLGPWAVNLALSVGIFPYVLKLLQSSARELRPLLVSIWAKILAVDNSCQTDLIRDQSHRYFTAILQDDCMMATHRTLSAFILATIVNKYPQGQKEAETANLIAICLENLYDNEPLLRQWLAIALGREWDKYPNARWRGARDNAHEKLYELLKDPVPEVRASAVFALGTFINACEERTEHADKLDHAITLHLLQTALADGSPVVRLELIIALSYVVHIFEPNFITVCRLELENEQQQQQQQQQKQQQLLQQQNRPGSTRSANRSRDLLSRITPSASSPSLENLNNQPPQPQTMHRSGSGAGNSPATPKIAVSVIFSKAYSGLQVLSKDPHPDIAVKAESILFYLRLKARDRSTKPRLSNILDVESSSLSFLQQGGPETGAVRKAPASVHGGAPGASSSTERVEQGQRQGPGSDRGHRSSSDPNAENHRSRSHNPSPNTTQNAQDLLAPEFTTKFSDWSAKFFMNELMTPNCYDHESEAHWAKEWLYERNVAVRLASENQRELLKSRACKLDDARGTFRTYFQPSHVCFHPYNDQVSVAGQRQIHIQDLETSTQLLYIELKEKRYLHTYFTGLRYINSHDIAMLVAGASDGTVRVYREDEKALGAGGKPSVLVTAWNALPELESLPPIGVSSPRNPFCYAWEQKTRKIAVSGSAVPILRLWDAEKEMKTVDISLSEPGASGGGPSNGANSLDFSHPNSNIVVVGLNTGYVKLYDIRCRSSENGAEHDARILDCGIQDSGGYIGHVVSCSEDGEVKVSDPRRGGKDSTLKSFNIGQPASRMVIHPRAPLVASWTASQSLMVHSLLPGATPAQKSGYLVNQIKNQDSSGGLLSGHRTSTRPVGCLAFHPHLLQIATALTDGAVGLFSLRKTEAPF